MKAEKTVRTAKPSVEIDSEAPRRNRAKRAFAQDEDEDAEMDDERTWYLMHLRAHLSP